MTPAAWIVLALLAALLFVQAWYYIGKTDEMRRHYNYLLSLKDKEIAEQAAMLRQSQHQRRVLNEIPVSRLIGGDNAD